MGEQQSERGAGGSAEDERGVRALGVVQGAQGERSLDRDGRELEL